MSNLSEFYRKIVDAFTRLGVAENLLEQRRRPKLSDKHLLALSLAAECCGIDSERHLFKQLPDVLNGRIERTVYNRRRRALHGQLNLIRQRMVRQIENHEACYLIDSMPIEVCRLARSRRLSICQENPETAPDTGYCAAQKQWYHGYKLHAVCDRRGVIQMCDLSQASVHDIHFLEDVSTRFSRCVLVGDKGYLSKQWQADLLDQRQIDLKTPPRKNQINSPELPKDLRRARKRIETVFSQLCDQFMIRRNYAKTFSGISARVLAKVTAFTQIQWLNFNQGEPISCVKIAFS